MRVADILRLKGNKIFSIGPEGSLAEAVSLMVTEDIGSLVVMQGGQMIGMITFREVLAAVHARGGTLTGATVGDVMVRNPVCCKPDDTVDDMRAVMTDQHIRYLPIRQDGQLLGVLSFHDVARAALKAASLENRALKFAAKGVDPKAIERSVGEQAERMEAARNALAQGRTSPAAGDEIEAGAEAIRKGIDGQAISLLAKSAPSGRSLAVPLFVIGSLTDRGLPSDEALNRVLDRLKARASDADLESMPGQLPARVPPGQAKKDGATGREFGQGHNPSAGRPASAGPPAGVPGNPGKKANPGQGRKPPGK